MPTAFEVPANELINRLAKHLKENVSEISPPSWSEYAKTGAHKERPPQDPDWWYARCASLLRKLYVHGPVGVSRLRVQYGGDGGKGELTQQQRRARGSAIREAPHHLHKGEPVGIEGRERTKMTKKRLTTLNKKSP